MTIYMETIIRFGRPLVLLALTLTGFVTSTRAQEVSIPDSGLNAAICEALQRPSGPLTEHDLLSLINLDAGFRDVSSVEGLAAARNLERLLLDSDRLTNLSSAGFLNNQLTTITLPPDITELTGFFVDGNPLCKPIQC